jgi:hypothetical protein
MSDEQAPARVCACGALLAAYNTNHPTMRPHPGDLTTCRCGVPLIFELHERVLGAIVLRPRLLTPAELEALPPYLRAQLEVFRHP